MCEQEVTQAAGLKRCLDMVMMMKMRFHHHHHDLCSSTFMFRASSISSSAAPAPRFCNACMSSYNWPICWSTNDDNQYSSVALPPTHIPLIFSSFSLSILASFQPSCSSICAYSCHSVRKPTCKSRVSTGNSAHHPQGS